MCVCAHVHVCNSVVSDVLCMCPVMDLFSYYMYIINLCLYMHILGREPHTHIHTHTMLFHLPCSLPMDSPLYSSSGMPQLRHSSVSSHTHAARVLGGGVGSVNGEDEIDSGSDEDERDVPHPLLEETLAATQESSPESQFTSNMISVPVAPAAGKGYIKSMVTRMAKKVASTRLVQRAAEKVSSYPLVLTVEMNRFDGVLAINIPPPPTDTIWYVVPDQVM